MRRHTVAPQERLETKVKHNARSFKTWSDDDVSHVVDMQIATHPVMHCGVHVRDQLLFSAHRRDLIATTYYNNITA